MPIYEYECKKCGKRLEALIRNETDVPSRCPECGSRLSKAFSTFSVSGPAAPRHEPSGACASCPSSGCPHSGRMGA